MNDDVLLVKRRGAVAWLTLNRPDAANTFVRDVIVAGLRALEDLEADDSVRVLVITGTGERHFCGGGDLRNVGTEGAITVGWGPPLPRVFIEAVFRISLPVVAAVNGAAAGGGCQLALACDFRIVADSAFFTLTETTFGAIPAAGGTQLLPRTIGMGRAKEMIMTGRRVGAAEALQWGLATEVVPASEVRERAQTFAEALAARPSFALRAAKAMVNDSANIPLDAGFRQEIQLAMNIASQEDRQAAIADAMERTDTYKRIFDPKDAQP